jgi:putative inorganic carbon (HCO3(-)) transporter
MAVIVPTAVAACQLVTRQGLHTSGVFSRITGTFAHSNPLAYFAIFTWFLMLATYPVVRGTSRRLVLIALVATTALTFFSFTRSAWIVAAIGLLILLLRRRSYTAVVAVCAVLLLGVAAPPIQSRFADLGSASQITGKPANSMSWRFAYWHKSLEIAEPSPIAGVGLRAVSMTTTAAKQPHNDIVRAYVELGIPGLVSYLALLALMIWSSFVAALDAGRRRLGGIERAVTEAALVTAIGIGLLSLVANLMSQVVVMAYAVTILALSSGAYLRRRRIDAERAKA